MDDEGKNGPEIMKKAKQFQSTLRPTDYILIYIYGFCYDGKTSSKDGLLIGYIKYPLDNEIKSLSNQQT